MAQALAHHLTPTPGDRMMEYIREDIERRKKAEVMRRTGGVEPTIRLNHPVLGTNFQLSSGRTPERGPDGSFMVTVNDLHEAMMFKGVWRVEE